MAVAIAQVKTRYDGAQYVSKSARCNRFKIINAPEDAVLVLTVAHSYDTEAVDPVWLPISGASALAHVVDGTAVFTLLFGPAKEEELKPTLINIRIPRPTAALVPKEESPVSSTPVQMLPDLLFTVQVVGGSELLTKRVSLYGLWDSAVEHDASTFYSKLDVHEETGFVVSNSLFFKLREMWSVHFDCNVVPFNHNTFLRMIRMAYQPAYSPLLVPELLSPVLVRRRATKSGTSIIRVFQSLIDLLGRFTLLRSLYTAGWIALVSSADVFDFALEGVNVPSTVFFFRLSRSYTPEPSLVIEMYDVGHNNQLTHRQPSCYVTATQLEEAGGDPLVAFSRVTKSVHLDVLHKLTWEGMLRPVWKTTTHITFYASESTFSVGDGAHTDPAWWNFLTPQ